MQKIIKSKVMMILVILCQYQNHRRKKICRYICLSMLLLTSILILSGCQKKNSVLFYMGESSYEDSLDELQVSGGDYQAALVRCEKRLAQLQDKEGIEAADIYSIMGGIYAENVWNQQEAIFYIDMAIEIHRRKEDEVGLAGDYNQMAKVYIHIGGDQKEGMEYLVKAEQICINHNLNDSMLMAGTLVNKGRIEEKEKQYEKALESYKTAQKIYEKNQIQETIILVFIGDVYVEMEEYEQAEEQYLKAKRTWSLENNAYRKAEVNSQMGNLYKKMKKYDQSIECYTQALAFYEAKENYSLDKAIDYNNIGETYYYQYNLKKAIESAINACKIIESGISVSEKSKNTCKENLALYYKDWGEGNPDEEFESWYQRVVLDGEEWRN